MAPLGKQGINAPLGYHAILSLVCALGLTLLLSFLFLNNYFIHFLIPFGNFGPPYLSKATADARAALPSLKRACWVFSCFSNYTPNSDTDYGVFNVRAWSFLCVRIHTRGWAHRQRVSTTIVTGKHSRFLLVPLTGFEPRVFGCVFCLCP